MRLLLTALALLVAACASPPAKQQEALERKPVCCRSMVDMPYGLLELGKPQVAVLDSSAPAFEFAAGKSYFAAYRVEAKEGRFIFVRSHFNGMMIGQYFFPVFRFLDEQHQPVASLAPRLRFVRGNLFAEERNAHMAGAVPVPPNAHFLVVSTSTSSPPAEVAITAPSTGVFMVGKTPVVTQSPGANIALTRTPTGTLELRLLDR